MTESLNDIRKKGIDALSKSLGPIGMVRFLQQFDTGKGDYTKERSKRLSNITVDDIYKEIKTNRKQKG